MSQFIKTMIYYPVGLLLAGDCDISNQLEVPGSNQSWYLYKNALLYLSDINMY